MIRLLAILLAILTSGFLLEKQRKPPKVGDIAPSFQAVNQYNTIISSDSLLKKGKLIVIFYRGNWCPYCHKHLSDLQDSLALIKQKGATLVLITPETPESYRKTIRKTNAQYSILHDKNYRVMRAYQVAYKISEKTVPKYITYVKRRTRWANDNNDNVLPVPATFIINQEKKIVYKHFDNDYTKRSTVKEILTYL